MSLRCRNARWPVRRPDRAQCSFCGATSHAQAGALAGAILVALLVDGAQSQQLPGRAAEPVPYEEQVDQPKAHQPVSEMPMEPPSQLAEPITENTKGNAHGSDEAPTWTKMGELFRAAVGFVLWRWQELALTAFNGLLAYFSYRLYRATSDLRDTARDQHSAMMASVAVGQQGAAAAEKSAKIAEDTLVATQRPWVTVSIQVGGPLTYSVKGATIAVRFNLKNIGHSPAIHVWNDVQIITPAFDKNDYWNPDPQAKLRQIFSNLKNQPPHPMGYVLFPGTTVVQKVTVMINSEELKRITEHDDFIMPVVMGAVSYRFAFGNRDVHLTGFSVDVCRSDKPRPESTAKNRSPAAIFPDEGDVPQAELRLVPSLMGGGDYAD